VRVWELVEQAGRLVGRLETLVAPLQQVTALAHAPEAEAADSRGAVVVGFETGELLTFDLVNFPDLGQTSR
jgi:hypothetical protein